MVHAHCIPMGNHQEDGFLYKKVSMFFVIQNYKSLRLTDIFIIK
jgi:hypothetical protein